MRKQIIASHPESLSLHHEQGWFDLTQQAKVELTSEDAAYPIEGALDLQGKAGWQAAHVGEQCIRIIFDDPQDVRRIKLFFEEEEKSRTQEFVLRWSSDDGRNFQDIVRQQYNFTPPHTTQELEDYDVNLWQATIIELNITPNIHEEDIPASLTYLRIA